VRTPLDDRVRDRIIAEARGNPLALLELPLSASPAELAGGFEMTDAVDVPRRIEDSFRLRSSSLPNETQLLLLVAAADPTGDVTLLWSAAAHLGIDPDWASPAEAAGLLELDTGVRFRHPLVRSAVYQAAAPPDRRRAHAALAAVTDPSSPPIGVPGIRRSRCWVATRTSRQNWSAPPVGRAPAAGWLLQLRSCSTPSN
jgi:hypothetical protein